MKDSLFQLLLNLFEKSLNHEAGIDPFAESDSEQLQQLETPAIHGSNSERSFRILGPLERLKLTKSSYRFIQLLLNTPLLEANQLETVLHQIEQTDASYVSLDEVKWIVREVLQDAVDENRLAFIDLVLSSNDAETRH